MTILLDTILELGDRRVAAVARTRVDVTAHAQWVGGRCAKAPVAVLVSIGGEVSAFSPDGSPMPLEKVGRMCPDALEAFRNDG